MDHPSPVRQPYEGPGPCTRGAVMPHDGPMRILVSSTPGLGHLLPMLPLARAARERGHEVVIASGSSLAQVAAAAGFPHEAMGPATIGAVVDDIPELVGLTGRRRAVVTLRRAFCETIAPAMADGVSELAERWRPDVIVHEDRELGSWVAAERLGIPHVTVQATAWRPRMTDIGNEPLNALRERYGLARDEGLAGLYGRLFSDHAAPVAPRRRCADARDDRRAPADRGRPTRNDHGAGPGPVSAPRWAASRRDHARHGELRPGGGPAGAHRWRGRRRSTRRRRARRGPGVTGHGPGGRFGPRVRADVELLPAADLVAFHGGSGTMLAALAAGTPMIIVPFAADQPDNADRCLAAGVARVLAPEGLDAGAVKDRRRSHRLRPRLRTPRARGRRRGRGHAGTGRRPRSDRNDRGLGGVMARRRTLGT